MLLSLGAAAVPTTYIQSPAANSWNGKTVSIVAKVTPAGGETIVSVQFFVPLHQNLWVKTGSGRLPY